MHYQNDYKKYNKGQIIITMIKGDRYDGSQPERGEALTQME